MLEMRLPTEAQLKKAYKRDLKPSFPAAELKPLREMLAEMKRDEYRPWCLFDGDEIVGEAFVWTHVPGFALFDYLCVSQERRNGGLGSTLIQKLVESERGNVLFGCVFSVPYRTLFWADRPVDDAEMAAAHAACYRNSLPRPVYDRFVTIPWEPSMGIPTNFPWLGQKET